MWCLHTRSPRHDVSVNILITNFTNRNVHHLLRNTGNWLDCNWVQTGKQSERMRHRQTDINTVVGHYHHHLTPRMSAFTEIYTAAECYALFNMFSFLLGVTCFHFFLGVKLLGQMVKYMFTFIRNCQGWFLKWTAPFYTPGCTWVLPVFLILTISENV